MKLNADCFPCYMRQALQAARFTTDDVAMHWKAQQAVARFIANLSPDDNPTDSAQQLHQCVKDALGVADPYLKVKEEYTIVAERLEPMIGQLAGEGDDPLMSAVKIAIAGNIIDFGAGGTFDVETAIRGALDYHFAVNHYDAFKAAVERARTVLYLGDNTGEIYFDKPLLRLLQGREITFVVRGGPVLNDATMEYALRAGLDAFASLADTGVPSPGFPLVHVRPEVRALFESADLVIAKGQANFESLHDNGRPALFFLLKSKCQLVARLLGVEFGDILLMESGRVPYREA